MVACVALCIKHGLRDWFLNNPQMFLSRILSRTFVRCFFFLQSELAQLHDADLDGDS